MKIGVDVRCLLEPHYSGISEYTHNLIAWLLKIDQKNQYVLFSNSKKAMPGPKISAPNVVYREFRYPNKIFNLSLRFLRLSRIDELIGGVDVFLTPNFLFTNLSGHCRRILIVHDLSFEIYPEFFTFKKRLWHNLIGSARLCRQADQIIAISENTKADIVRLYGIKPQKIQVISPGIHGMFFEPITSAMKEKVKAKYNLSDDYIFYLGNLEPRKNLEALVVAFNKIKDPALKLVMAGSQAWKYKKIYHSWQDSPERKRIKFLGYIEAADKPALYALAKIFVYPSIYEGFGLPPLEAMACGTPVIAGCNSSLTEVLHDAGVLVDPNNVEDLACAINQLLNDSKMRQCLRERGLSRSRNFSWQNTAERVLRVLSP